MATDTDVPVKVVLDCSGASLASTIPAILQQASDAALAGDVDTTNTLLALAQERAAAAALEPAAETIQPLDDDELAQLAVDATAAAAAAVADTAAAFIVLTMKRDRYLAQTDRLMLPPASMPIDTPSDISTAMANPKTQQAWTAFREALRTMFDNITDPDAVTWPEQPATPVLILT